MVMLKLEEQPPLIQAIFSGEIEDVKALLENKPDVNYQDAEKRSPLHAAAYKGDRSLAELLLGQGARVNTKDSRWLTPLHRACGVGADDIVELLLKHKADTTARDRQWQTPLHIAAASNAIGCIEHLLNHITNVNVTDRSGCTALHHAALNGHNHVVELLLSRGSIVNACDKKDCRPIHWAAHLGHVETVNILIQNGADINVKDRNQYTPLHAATASGMVYVCSLLLTAGADVNAQNAFGNTPLHIACLNGHLSVCQILLAHNANVEAVNYKGQTALHISAASTQGVGCLAYLLEQERVDINRQSADGRTPLHMSAIYGRFTRSKRLIDKGAVVDCADKNGNTALHIAAQYGHDILTATLLDFGAEATKRGYEGRTPLHVCCLSGYVEVCRKFLQAAVDLNIVDEHGRTPIHCAAYKGSVECLDLLVSRGGNFKLQDAIGRTALHYAAVRGHYNCVYTLVGIGSPVNVLDLEGCSVLHLAAAYDTEGKCVEYLLQHKADPLLRDVKGFTPIHYAVNGSNRTALELLLKAVGKSVNFLEAGMPETTPLHLAARQADLNILRAIVSFFPETNIKTVKEGYTPLVIAAREGHTPNVQMLLRYGAKVAICDDVNGMSAVHYSAKNGHLHCLALLVDNAEVKSIIDQQDRFNRTALMLAISGSHQDCAITLLKSNSDPNIVDTDLHSSLFRAVVTDQNNVVQLLIGAGSVVTSADINGKTVLHLAAACGHLKCLQKILQNVDDTEALVLDKNGFSALHWACYYGNANCLDYLLQKNIYKQLEGNPFTPVHCAAFTGSERCLDLLHTKFGVDCVKAQDTRNRTPLHLAAWHGHADCVRFLLDNGGDVEARDEIGRSPLISAAQNGQSQVIDLLLAHKADLKAADSNGNTALHVACLRRHNHTALLLLEYISDVEIINMVDNDKKTALHLAARNGLVEVTGELIKKGASVIAADNNGLTPALYCAPNACVAQCLAIILANHPIELATNNQHHIKESMKILKKLFKLTPSHSNLRHAIKSSQTEISLLRNPRELFLGDDLKLRQHKKRSSCIQLQSIGNDHSKMLKRTCTSIDFPTKVESNKELDNGNNLILIENYDADDFDVSELRTQGGLGLHRSFSEIALVQHDFGPSNEMVAGNRPDKFQPKDEERIKEAAYEKLVNGYKTIALKMAQITNHYDVSIDDIQKAYIAQYIKKKSERWGKYQKEMRCVRGTVQPASSEGNTEEEEENWSVAVEANKMVATFNKEHLEKELQHQLVQLRQQTQDDEEPVCETVAEGVKRKISETAKSMYIEEILCKLGNEDITRVCKQHIPEVAIEHQDNEEVDEDDDEEGRVPLIVTQNVKSLEGTYEYDVESISANLREDDLAVNKVSADTATAMVEIDVATDHGDWLYDGTTSKRYCDCQYVCGNCVLMNRYDDVHLERRISDYFLRDDWCLDDDDDNGVATCHTYQFPGAYYNNHSNGPVDGDSSDSIDNEPIYLEHLTVVEPKVYVGEGAIKKSRVCRDVAAPSKTNASSQDTPTTVAAGGGGAKPSGNRAYLKEKLLEINESEEVIEVDRDVDHGKECAGASASWPKITFDNECVKMPKDLQTSDDADLEMLDPSRDLDWSLFTDSISSSMPLKSELVANMLPIPGPSCNYLLDTATSVTALVAVTSTSSSTMSLSACSKKSSSRSKRNDKGDKVSPSTIPPTTCSSLTAVSTLQIKNKLSPSTGIVSSCLNLKMQPDQGLFEFPCGITMSEENMHNIRTVQKKQHKSKKSKPAAPATPSCSSGNLSETEDELLVAIHSAHDKMKNITYEEFLDLSEGLNMSKEAKAIAQRLVELPLDVNANARRQKQKERIKATVRKVTSSDAALDLRSRHLKHGGSDSGIETSCSSLESVSMESLERIEEYLGGGHSSDSGDTQLSQPCKKTASIAKLKRPKRPDDNKCCIS